MSKADLIECLCFAGLRLLAFALALAGLLQLVFALLDAWYHFDPNYLGAFFSARLLRPLLILLWGLILYPLAPSLARFMARPARSRESAS